MADFKVDVSGIDKLQNAMKNFQGNAEKAINEVLHNEGSTILQESIQNLIPTSERNWSGKAAPAKTAKSLTGINSNLAVTITTTKRYQYLYFPDDGTNTRRHVGNKQFFRRGAEAKQDEIVERCINKLINSLETT